MIVQKVLRIFWDFEAHFPNSCCPRLYPLEFRFLQIPRESRILSKLKVLQFPFLMISFTLFKRPLKRSRKYAVKNNIPISIAHMYILLEHILDFSKSHGNCGIFRDKNWPHSNPTSFYLCTKFHQNLSRQIDLLSQL